ncbi:hypothetical protein KKI93_12595 [Xenorhabdus bovienii]|uniref:hypothetical protein n=1 Tax=Xenorhabdus bovienii TaxID=40576 RepID=UPI0023B2D917|nr:hypothetical protein [Xenorhabdus bovienii]MDE9484018.1 hypothetical protein [Xenorhabdus bovienii]MDE9564874.1 hypothetical protein [Xenorhabdus bovienii]
MSKDEHDYDESSIIQLEKMHSSLHSKVMVHGSILAVLMNKYLDEKDECLIRKIIDDIYINLKSKENDPDLIESTYKECIDYLEIFLKS